MSKLQAYKDGVKGKLKKNKQDKDGMNGELRARQRVLSEQEDVIAALNVENASLNASLHDSERECDDSAATTLEGESGGRRVSLEVMAAATVGAMHQGLSDSLGEKDLASRLSDDTRKGETDSSSSNSNLKLKLVELQATYNALLSRTTSSERACQFRISKLESLLKIKGQEVICVNATMFSLRGRISVQEEDLALVTKERDSDREELFKLRKVLADESFNGNINNLCNPLDGENPSLFPHHLSPLHNNMMMPGDVSNCSSEIEELQSKMEEILAERDAADEQIKELLNVQLQKDELLVKLQDAKTMLELSEEERKDEKDQYERLEREMGDDAAEKRERMSELEGMLEVLTGQRDRASARVRKLLLSRNNSLIDDEILENGGKSDDSRSPVEKVLASFKFENDQLSTTLKETKAQVLLFKADKASAVEKVTKLGGIVKELQSQIDTLQAHNSKLQQEQRCTNTFHESSFQASQDDCLRELENINIDISNNLAALDENASFNDSLSSTSGEGTIRTLASPPPNTAVETCTANLTSTGSPLNVPSLAAAEADELTDVLGSLGSSNDFEDFLSGLGLEDELQLA